MRDYDFDLFTIGAGSGGVAASRRAGGYGARVAICEEDRVGGTCVLRGCVPKKLLWYGSHFRDEIEDARGYGWSFEGVSLDWRRLIEAKRAELDRLNGIYLKMLGNAGVKLMQGRGRIVDPHTVEVEGREFTAARILIATGGWPSLPEIPGVERGITSNEVLDLEEVPEHVAIVGGGYIAVEFAGILHGAGSKVTMIVRSDALLNGFDDDIRVALAETMGSRGIEIRYGNHVNAVEKVDSGRLRLRLDRGDHLEVDQVLFATGRHPHSSNLGLEEVGVQLDHRNAIIVDEWSCTNVKSIYAVGDVTHRLALTPLAIADGRAFAETEFNDNPMPIDHASVPTAVFSQPPIATVGLTEEQARDLGVGEIDCYHARFRPMQFVLPGRDEKTLMKLVVERDSDRVLGIHMVGPDAAEIVQGLAIAVKAKVTKAQFDSTVGIHPTSAEEFVTMYTRSS